MASASVSALGGCGAFAAMGSLGLVRANGPIAAHPPFRMHRIPPGAVFATARISKETRGGRLLLPETAPEERRRRDLVIRPRLAPFVYAGLVPHREGRAFARLWLS